jgi:CRISPR/Cas system-associated protein endoribonuclease Cas2
MTMLNTAIPVYQKEKTRSAIEKIKGHRAFTLDHNPTNIHFLNANCRLILNLCDGKNSIANIHEALKKHFPHASSEILHGDLKKFLTNMSIQGLVKWADDYNPLCPRESNCEIKIDENICLKRATEKDFSEIVVFLQRVVFDGQQNNHHKDFIVIASPIVYSGMYCDLMIRARMFNYSERFFFS